MRAITTLSSMDRSLLVLSSGLVSQGSSVLQEELCPYLHLWRHQTAEEKGETTSSQHKEDMVRPLDLPFHQSPYFKDHLHFGLSLLTCGLTCTSPGKASGLLTPRCFLYYVSALDTHCLFLILTLLPSSSPCHYLHSHTFKSKH